MRRQVNLSDWTFDFGTREDCLRLDSRRRLFQDPQAGEQTIHEQTCSVSERTHRAPPSLTTSKYCGESATTQSWIERSDEGNPISKRSKKSRNIFRLGRKSSIQSLRTRLLLTDFVEVVFSQFLFLLRKAESSHSVLGICDASVSVMRQLCDRPKRRRYIPVFFSYSRLRSRVDLT